MAGESRPRQAGRGPRVGRAGVEGRRGSRGSPGAGLSLSPEAAAAAARWDKRHGVAAGRLCTPGSAPAPGAGPAPGCRVGRAPRAGGAGAAARGGRGWGSRWPPRAPRGAWPCPVRGLRGGSQRRAGLTPRGARRSAGGPGSGRGLQAGRGTVPFGGHRGTCLWPALASPLPSHSVRLAVAARPVRSEARRRVGKLPAHSRPSGRLSACSSLPAGPLSPTTAAKQGSKGAFCFVSNRGIESLPRM